jgi:hypothetical protein
MREILIETALLWSSNVGIDTETTTDENLALLIRDGVENDLHVIERLRSRIKAMEADYAHW